MKGPTAKKRKSALAYQICAILELDDHTYTHLTCKADSETFLIQQFELKYEEVNEHNLIKVFNSSKIVEGTEKTINSTGHQVHSIVYLHRPDIQAIFHINTIWLLYQT